LNTEFGVEYESRASYHFLLKYSGLSFHKPEPFDRRRDVRAINQRMDEITAEIAPKIADPGWLVFASDEVRVDQEADIRRAWCRVGEAPEIRVDRDREAQSYIGFLNQNDGCCEFERLDWQNGPEILRAVNNLVSRHPGKRICIVWDNAAWHRTRLIREELRKGGTLEQVHLIAMPPYAPDHNPIEHVWKAAKDHCANVQQPSFDATLQKFEEYITGRRFEYRIS
jgi:transposase